MEDETAIEARIDSLMQLFELSNSEEVETMVLNVLETYRKLLIREMGFQNRISWALLDKLLKSYMIVLCHRKQYDNLYSIVSCLQVYFQFLRQKISISD